MPKATVASLEAKQAEQDIAHAAQIVELQTQVEALRNEAAEIMAVIKNAIAEEKQQRPATKARPARTPRPQSSDLPQWMIEARKAAMEGKTSVVAKRPEAA